LAVSGTGTAFGMKKRKSYNNLKGKTSNAILLVDANQFVPWTKPEDFQVDWEASPYELGGTRLGG